MDEQLKRRLIGATLLVALMVIFLPMLFEDREPPPAPAPEAVPALPEGIEEKTIELPRSASDVAPPPEPAAPALKEKPAQRSGYQIVPLDDGAAKPAKGRSSRAGREVPPPPPEAPVAEEGADEDVPLQEPARAPAAAPPIYRPVVERPAVRPGVDTATETETPVPADDARKAKAGAKTGTRKPKTEAPVAKPEVSGATKPAQRPAAEVPRPVKTAPANTETKPKAKPPVTATAPGSFAVQAGTFSSEANAKALVDKLKKQNLPAYVRVLKGESGTVYRVTVGPELNHAKAQEIQKKVESAAGVKAMVVPRP